MTGRPDTDTGPPSRTNLGSSRDPWDSLPRQRYKFSLHGTLAAFHRCVGRLEHGALAQTPPVGRSKRIPITFGICQCDSLVPIPCLPSCCAASSSVTSYVVQRRCCSAMSLVHHIRKYSALRLSPPPALMPFSQLPMQDRAPRSASALRKPAPCMHRPLLLSDCDPGYTGCRRAYRIRNQLHLAARYSFGMMLG